MSKKIFCVITLSCAIIASSASLLHAQDALVDSHVNNTTGNTGTGVSGDADVITKSKPSSDAIIITGRRYESSVLKEGKSVTVITEEDIKASGKDDVAQVLETVPGITISREGTDSGMAFIFMRGAEGGNVLVMIDGIKISDPSSTDGRFDLSLIKTESIERIEIVRGSMSSLYGSEASGGVINIITKKGSGKSILLKFTGGSYDSFSQSVSVNESGEKSSFYFSGSHYTSGGISSVKDMTGAGNFDEDKTENYTASCKMTGEWWEKASMMFSMNYSDKKIDIDSFGFDDPDDNSSNSMFGIAGEFRHSPFVWWDYRTGLSLMSIKRIYDYPPNSAATYESRLLQGQIVNKFTVPVIGTLSIGADVANESADTFYGYGAAYTFMKKDASTASLYVHDAFSLVDMLFINGGLRLDNHNEFGNHYTWDVSGAFIIPLTETKLRASAGSAFKAPNLYQLYDGTYGNTGLDPETSFIYDAGIYQEIFFSESVVSFEGTYFYQKYLDTITLVAGKYSNIDGESDIQGAEFSLTFRLADILSIGYTYTRMDFIKNSKNLPFLRRPENKHSLIIALTPLSGLSANVSYQYIGSKKDIEGYEMTPPYDPVYCTIEPYHKIDANIRYTFNEMLTVTVRGENLTDADYMDTYGYNTYGRSFFGGVELTF